MDESINLEINNNEDNLMDITFNGLNNNLLDSPTISSRSPKREKRLRNNKPPMSRPDVFVINEDDEEENTENASLPPLTRTQSNTNTNTNTTKTSERFSILKTLI